MGVGKVRQEVLQAPSTPCRPWYTRVGELALGISANWLITLGFDYMLYPAVIWWLGLLRGGLVMAGLSLVVCLLTLWFYDWSQRDWLGIEAIKRLKTYEGKNRFRRVMATMLGWGDIPACVLLSVYYDPFITLIYLRPSAFGKLARRDWIVFFTSWALGNAWWMFACYFGVTLLDWAWGLICHR